MTLIAEIVLAAVAAVAWTEFGGAVVKTATPDPKEASRWHGTATMFLILAAAATAALVAL